MNYTILTFILITLLSCKKHDAKPDQDVHDIDVASLLPLDFMGASAPEGKLVHKGILSPDFNHYYFTLSDIGYQQFDVYVIRKETTGWSSPRKAFFNSSYDEHGMSFSPDGKSIYFSSTRPTNVTGVADTWHLWRTDEVNGEWSEPVFIDIPNLRDKLISHPVITNSATLYFHSSNLDYSKMDIYQSKMVNGQWEAAKETSIAKTDFLRCTPYVSPDESFMIYASVSDYLELIVAFNDGKGGWNNARTLGEEVNNNGQGNPYVSPDGDLLLYTTGSHQQHDWKVNWVKIESELSLTH